MLMNIMNKALNSIAIMLERVKHEFIKSDFFFSFGKYLIRAILNPARDKFDINSIEDISVDAIPTCAVVAILTTIVQNRKPKPDNTIELIIRRIALLYNESFSTFLITFPRSPFP